MIIMWVPYILSYVIGYPLLIYLESFVADIFWRILYVDLVATVIVYAFSLYYRNTSIYDPYWMIIPIGFLIYLNQHSGYGSLTRNLCILFPPLLYNFKHIIYYFRFWPGLTYEDFRYVNF